MDQMKTREPAKPLEGKEKSKWTKVFVVFMVIFSLTCMAFMNYNYDSLSRYPYKDTNSRKLIKEYLNKEEIDYIIEYSIAPNVFISFIKEDGFNIYHAAEYKKLSEYAWEQTPANIVHIVEETRDTMDTDTLIVYLTHYSYDAVDDWFEHGDDLSPGSTLVEYAGYMDAYLDDVHTVGIRKPMTLQKLNDAVPTDSSQDILVDVSLQQPLSDLCSGIQDALGSTNACAGLNIKEGYISYDDQKVRYANAVEEYGEDSAVKYEPYPGHSEHQLGLAVDFGVSGITDDSFAKTEQSQWLASNAWKYGFVNTWNDYDTDITNKISQPYHYRFIGIELAATLHSEGITFAQYAEQESEAN